ncbi:hypothetical protein [Meiothermus granaticius]|nr:hypothetical protein [Meiothermus granaticius]
MTPTPAPKRNLARYLAALLNRCPNWVAALPEALSGPQLTARSPSGVVYAFDLQMEGPVGEAEVEGLYKALIPGQRGVMVCQTGEYTPAALERAQEHQILLWSFEQLDYLILAAELEMNAPLAYAGLEVEAPKTYAPEAEPSITASGVFRV